MTRSRAVLAVVAAALLFATGGAAIKSASLSAWQIGGFRSLIAFVVLWVALPAVRRRWQPAVFVVGVPYAATLLLFVHSNTLTLAVTTVLLQSSAPLYVALLAPWLLGESASKKSLVLLPVYGAGMVLLLSAGESATEVASAPDLGRWFAALAGVTFGLVIIGLRRLQSSAGGRRSSDEAAIQSVACGNLYAALVSLPFLADHWRPISALDLGVMVYLGAIQIGVAYIILVPALRVLSALDVSLLLLVELVASPIFAALFHDEIPGSRTFWGGGLIVIACAAQSLWAGRRSRAPVPR